MKNDFTDLFAAPFKASPDQVTLWAKGRVGLYALLKAMSIKKGDEVIMSGYTCVMVPSAPMFLGAACRYVDISPETYNLDPQQLDRHYSSRTKALIIQHTYGIAQEMEPVLSWAAAKGLPVIEDCCHAYGSTYKGRLCGSFGTGAFFSGQWNKPFSTGLGGMLLVNDARLAQEVQSLYALAMQAPAGENRLLSWQIAAYRSLITPKTTAAMTLLYRALSRLGLVKGSSSNAEFEGTMPADYFKAMAPAQLREGERNIANIAFLQNHRKEITAFYTRELPSIGFSALAPAPDSDNIILRYPVRIANKSEVLKKALGKGVEIGSWFEIPLHPEGIDMERFGYQAGMCPESEKACREVVNLPTHTKISLREAERVLRFLRKWARPTVSQ